MNPKVKVGDKIRIIKMNDRFSEFYIGKEGYIKHIDDMGYLHGNWGGLAVIPEEDEYELVEEV